jgi:hypothetical protein
MIFDYVVVNNTTDENGKVAQDIVVEGRVLAKDRENALLKIGVEMREQSEEITDDIQVLIRPF